MPVEMQGLLVVQKLSSPAPDQMHEILACKQCKPLCGARHVDDHERVVEAVAADAPTIIRVAIGKEVHRIIIKAHARVPVAGVVREWQPPNAKGVLLDNRSRLVQLAPHAPRPLARKFVVARQHDEGEPRRVLGCRDPSVYIDVARDDLGL